MARTVSTHWKFQRLARMLGSTVLARGILETVWETGRQADDAYLGTSQDLEALCEWRGAPGALTAALLMADLRPRHGFIESLAWAPCQYQIHDFTPVIPRRRVIKACRTCGELFHKAPTAKFCSDRCRQIAHRYPTTIRQEARP